MQDHCTKYPVMTHKSNRLCYHGSICQNLINKGLYSDEPEIIKYETKTRPELRLSYIFV